MKLTGNNVLREPVDLIFDDSIPHVRATCHLAPANRRELIEEFNTFLNSHADEIEGLKLKCAAEDGIHPASYDPSGCRWKVKEPAVAENTAIKPATARY